MTPESQSGWRAPMVCRQSSRPRLDRAESVGLQGCSKETSGPDNASKKSATAASFPLPVVLFWVAIATFTFFTAVLRGSEDLFFDAIVCLSPLTRHENSLLVLFVLATIFCSFWTTIVSTVATLIGTMTGEYQMHFAVYQLVGYLSVGFFLLMMLLV